MNSNAAKVAARALELVGQGYIYGAKGQTCSPAFRAKQAKQYPEQAETILNVGKKWDGMPVWDCAQLTREAAKAGNVGLVSGATSQWNKTPWARKGEIDTLPEGEACFVFRRKTGSTTVMQHVGVCLGNGTCVHARGTAYGVIHQPTNQYAWTHWASPWRKTEEVEPVAKFQAVVVAQSGSTVNLRLEPGGEVLARVAIGSVVDVTESGAEWCRITSGTLDGYMQTRFLKRVGDDAGDGDDGTGDGDTVTVSLTREDALALLAALDAATARG